MTRKQSPLESPAARTNVYLREAVKIRGKRIAKERYGISLSVLINQLVDLECKTKGGILHPRVSETTLTP